MGYIIGRNTRVEVQKTLSAAIPVNAITQANPGVASYTGGLAPVAGEVLVFDDETDGMFEIQGQVVRAGTVTTAGSPDTVQLERLDTTLYGALSGLTSVNVVSVWATLGNARTLSAGAVSPNRLDATVLLDRVKRYLLGQSDTPEITVDMLSNPFLEAMEIIVAAAENGTRLAFRVTCDDGSKRIFGGFVSLPSENIATGEIATGGFSIVQIGKRIAYPT